MLNIQSISLSSIYMFLKSTENIGFGNCCFVKDNNEASILHNSGLYTLQTVLFLSILIGISMFNELLYYCSLIIIFKIIFKFNLFLFQWEALALLLIGISINQLSSLPDGTMGVPMAMGAYICTFIFVSYLYH